MSDGPLHIAYVFPGCVDGAGGSEEQALAFIQASDPCRVEIELVFLGRNPTFERRAKAVPGLTIRVLRPEARNVLDPRMAVDYARLLRERRYDAVHLYGLRQELVTRPVSRLSGVRVVSAIRGSEAHRGRGHFLLNRATSGFVDLWISNSRFTADLFASRDKLRRERIVVVPNGVQVSQSLPPYNETLRRLINVGRNAFLVGCVANHLPFKRQEDLLAAMARIEGDPSMHLVLIGRTTNYTLQLQAQADRLNLTNRLHILGYRDDVRRLLAGMDVLALVSQQEGLPASLLEGMACGLPVVATMIAGVTELVVDGETGIGVPTEDVDAIARALTTLRDDQALRFRLGRAGFERARSEFSVERLAERLMCLYEDLAGTGGA